MELELRDTTDGSRALLAFTSLDQLVAGGHERPRHQGAKWFGRGALGRCTTARGRYCFRGGTKFGKIIPVAGLGLTGIGIGYDINQGKEPTQAVASGGSSLTTGAVVGSAIGGPIGAVLGGVAGVGVGFAVDQNWDSMIDVDKKLEDINPKMQR